MENNFFYFVISNGREKRKNKKQTQIISKTPSSSKSKLSYYYLLILIKLQFQLSNFFFFILKLIGIKVSGVKGQSVNKCSLSSCRGKFPSLTRPILDRSGRVTQSINPLPSSVQTARAVRSRFGFLLFPPPSGDPFVPPSKSGSRSPRAEEEATVARRTTLGRPRQGDLSGATMVDGAGACNPGNGGGCGGDPEQDAMERTRKAKSCKGCLYYSSILNSGTRNPVCVGISRTLPKGWCAFSASAGDF